MANPVFDRPKAIQAILDAARTTDRKACQKHGITDRTLRNWRSRLESDPELTAGLTDLGRAAERHWKVTANRTMGVLHQRMQELITLAGLEELAVLAKLHDSISNSDIALKALVGDSSDPEGAAAPEAGGNHADGEDGADGEDDAPRPPSH